MATSPAKKSTPQTTTKKATSPKKKVTKKTVAKKPATKKTSTKRRRISAEDRYKMTEVAAYYIAEHHNFQGNSIDFWIAAEKEVSKKIA